MTDLPQLQEALVGAARRRNRRSRARSAVVGLAAVAAVVIVAATAFKGPGEREREVATPPTPTPAPLSATPTAREAADRFAVLRGDSHLVQDVRGLDVEKGAQTYLWLRRNGYSHYVSVSWHGFNFGTGRDGKYYGGGTGTDVLGAYAEGRLAPFDKTPAGDAWLYAALVPDGVRDAVFIYRDGTTEPVPIKDNALALESDRQPVKVSWTTPDGERFTSQVGF
jgi:hypothetical protein